MDFIKLMDMLVDQVVASSVLVFITSTLSALGNMSHFDLAFQIRHQVNAMILLPYFMIQIGIQLYAIVSHI